MLLNVFLWMIILTGMTFADIIVNNPYIRLPVGPNTAAYMEIENTGSEADQLIEATCDFASAVELHEHINDNGIMRMRQVKSMTVEPNKPLILKPGDNHVMFFRVKGLKEDAQVPLTLRFAKAGDKKILCTIKPLT